jgi:hypothetical protein
MYTEKFDIVRTLFSAAWVVLGILFMLMIIFASGGGLTVG